MTSLHPPISCHSYVGRSDSDISVKDQSAHRWPSWVALARFGLTQEVVRKKGRLDPARDSIKCFLTGANQPVPDRADPSVKGL